MLDRVTTELAPMVPSSVEVLAGLEMGGIPVTALLSHKTKIPAAFVRKKAKMHGTARLSEGTEVAGKTVLIIEDVVTTGGQIIKSATELRKLDANVASCLCVVDRLQGGSENLAKVGVELISLFTASDFEAFKI